MFTALEYLSKRESICNYYVNNCTKCPLRVYSDCAFPKEDEFISIINAVEAWTEDITRQQLFLKVFPDAATYQQVLYICPRTVSNKEICPKPTSCELLYCNTCDQCRKTYWTNPIDQNSIVALTSVFQKIVDGFPDTVSEKSDLVENDTSESSPT